MAPRSPFEIYSDNGAPTMSAAPYETDAEHSLAFEDEPVLPPLEHSSPTDLRRASAFTNYTGVSSMPPSIAPGTIPAYTPHRPRKLLIGGAAKSPSNTKAFPGGSLSPFASPNSPNGRLRYGTPRRRAGMVGDLVEHFDSSGGVGGLKGFETPTSTRSHSLATQRSRADSIARDASVSSRSGTPSKTQRNLPLVLLHVTLLPPQRPLYSRALLDKVGAPAHIAENQALLVEKLSETVRQRGLLLPHPGEEYDLLEERLLESLELCAPRVLGCGHFYGGDNAEDGEETGMDAGISILREPGFVHAICRRGSRKSGSDSGFDSNPDDDICAECCQPMHLPNKGVGHGKRRWDVKIYAANGLMRAGAWAAAWKEMERVDVEIDVWIPEEMRRELERSREAEEEEEQKRQLRAEEEHIERTQREREEMLERKLAEDAERSAMEMVSLNKSRHEAEEARLKAETRILELEADVETLKSALAASVPVPEHSTPSTNIQQDKQPIHPRPQSQSRERQRLPRARKSPIEPAEIPLSTLLRNYIYLLSQDRRNIALVVLTFALLFLAYTNLSPAHRFDPVVAYSDLQQLKPSADRSVIELAPMVSTLTVTNTVVLSEPPSSSGKLAAAFESIATSAALAQTAPSPPPPPGCEPIVSSSTLMSEGTQSVPSSSASPRSEQHTQANSASPTVSSETSHSQKTIAKELTLSTALPPAAASDRSENSLPDSGEQAPLTSAAVEAQDKQSFTDDPAHNDNASDAANEALAVDEKPALDDAPVSTEVPAAGGHDALSEEDRAAEADASNETSQRTV